MIIDVYTHILPKKYQEGLEKEVTGRDPRLSTLRYAKIIKPLLDLEARFKVMDPYGEYIQMISVASSPIYDIAPPEMAGAL